MATIKGKLKQKTSTGSNILHPETEADLVKYSGTIGETSVDNVKSALDTIISAGVGVTDVQNGSGTSLVEDTIATVTPDNIGAVAKNNNNLSGATKCKITYDSKGLVTAGADLAVSDLPSNIPTSKITGLGAAASMNVTTSATGIWPSSTDDTLVTAKAVYKAIDSLPDPMEFMGTLGTDGTITALQPPAAVKKGWTYKVIESGEYSYTKASGTGKVIAKEGDVVINNGTDWILIPSGDDIEDTWRGIKVNGTPKLGNGISTGDVDFVGEDNVTVSFNSTGNKITIGVADNYSIPSTTKQNAWDAKQNALTEQTAYSAKGTTTKVPQITTNALGQVTKIEEKSIAFPDITIGSTGSGNAVTAIAVDSSNKHKINVTKGTTFLTSHQDISGKIDKSVLTTKGDMIYASAPSTPARLGIGSSGQILTVDSSGVPSWKDVPVSTVVKDVKNQDTLTQDEYDAFVNGKLLLRYVGTLPTSAFYPSLIQPSAVFPVAFRGFDNELNENKAAVSTCYYFDFGINVYSVSNNNAKLVLDCHYLSVKESTRQVQAYGAAPYDYASIDSVPTSNNYGNLISSGGVYDALANKADKVSMTAGTYSAVAVNSQGIVTAGGQVFEVVNNGATPSVVTNGLYFEKDPEQSA